MAKPKNYFNEMKWQLKTLLLLIIFFVCNHSLFAQKNIADNLSSPIQISILTCGPAPELYSSWGHSAIRITDTSISSDVVINYGMFDFEDPNFYWKYVKGTLLYYGAQEPYDNFLRQYANDGREVKEQVLNLSKAETNKLLNAIAYSLQEENKRYHYDFLYNNCSTKLRDMLDSVLTKPVVYNAVIAKDSLRYMADLNSYLQNKPWDKVGIDILLSSEVHKKVDNYTYMYLPEALYRGLNKTTHNGSPLVKKTNFILPDKQTQNKVINTPKWLFMGLAFILIISTILWPNKLTVKILQSIFLTLLGLLGCLFLFMWLGTNHLQTKHNLNLLWCLPYYVFAAFFIFSKKPSRNFYLISLICTIAAAILAGFFSTAWEAFPLIVAALVILWYRFKNANATR
jgi:hypothetical protein